MEFAKCNADIMQKTKTMAVGDSRIEGQSGSNVKSTLIEKEMKQL